MTAVNRTTQALLFLLSGVAFIEAVVAVAWTLFFGFLITGLRIWSTSWSVVALGAAGLVCLVIVFVLPVGTTTARGWAVGLVGLGGFVAVNTWAAFAVATGWLGFEGSLAVVLALADIVSAVLRDEHRFLPVSTLFTGQYGGISDVCLSAPCVVGLHGAAGPAVLPLDDVDLGGLRACADALHHQNRLLGLPSLVGSGTI